MFLVWKANPKQRLSSVLIDRSKEYGTPLGPWSRVHYTNEGIVQSILIERAQWGDHHHRSLLPDCEENIPDDLHHPSVFDFLSNTVNTVDSELNLSNIEETITINISTKTDVVENIYVGKCFYPSKLEIYNAPFREFGRCLCLVI